MSLLLSEDIKRAARQSGFGLVGLARAEPLDPAPLSRWLDAGMHASMAWMAERFEERLDPARLWPGAKTVIALGACFMTAQHRAPSPIALYARGRDYHATLRDRLRALRRRLVALDPGAKIYGEVDTGPVLERAWAERAGLGWIGKNAMLLHPDHGSWPLLAVAIVDREADRYDSPGTDRCGGCTLCLKACPTGALIEPGVVDSRLCLSYQTIENRDLPPEALRARASGLAFGCDLCQTVCPWNKPGHVCEDPRFLPREIASVPLAELALLTHDRWDRLTRGTAVARAQCDGLRRNALIAMGAARDPDLQRVAGLAADDESPSVREAARWALARARVP